MLSEVLAFLEPARGGPVWDLTLGGAGHLRAFLTAAPAGTAAIGFDGDPIARERAADLPTRVEVGDLLHLRALSASWPRPRAVLCDFGLSSLQVDDPARGFSYRLDGPLDMRMNPTDGPTASEWLQDVSQRELESILRDYGEERYAGRIARVIKESLPLDTTTALADAVVRAVGSHRDRTHHPARRTFQAVRIAVNQEYERIEMALRVAMEALLPGGRLVVLSYHSGEDRIAKVLFREAGHAGQVQLLTKRPLEPSDAECETNPRARSAKLRAVERVAD